MPKNVPKIIDYIQEYKNILSPKLCEQIIKYYDSIDGWNKSTFGTKDGLSPETNEKVDMDEQWITKKDNGGLYGDLLAGFKIALQKYTEEYPDIVSSTFYTFSYESVILHRVDLCQDILITYIIVMVNDMDFHIVTMLLCLWMMTIKVENLLCVMV